MCSNRLRIHEIHKQEKHYIFIFIIIIALFFFMLDSDTEDSLSPNHQDKVTSSDGSDSFSLVAS